MEKEFQSMLIGGEGTGDFAPVFSAGMYSGITFQSLLSLDNEKTLLPCLDYKYRSSSMSGPAIQNNQIGECSKDGDRKLKSIDFMPESKLKMPTFEPLNDVSTKPFNFISKSSDPISSLSKSSFHHLPDLHSLEQAHDFAVAESSRKRLKSFSVPTTDSYTLESILRNFQILNNFAAERPTEVRSPAVMPQSELARLRRQRISEKTRCLQKLLPWDRKMDTATMLSEAYKYIKFLQAQVSVLRSMPCDSSSLGTQNPWNGVDVFGGVGSPNRQQLLQVLVNSPVAQTILYSQGCCVYSVEQLAVLKKMEERNIFYQQMAFHPSTLS